VFLADAQESPDFLGSEPVRLLALRQFNHADELAGGRTTATDQAASARLAGPIHWLVEFELHRRKTFWVDESLAYMLAKTEVLGRFIW